MSQPASNNASYVMEYFQVGPAFVTNLPRNGNLQEVWGRLQAKQQAVASLPSNHPSSRSNAQRQPQTATSAAAASQTVEL
eukprot:scaffold566486_cov46-Prasinocladus_malaysianus.AAC.1